DRSGHTDQLARACPPDGPGARPHPCPNIQHCRPGYGPDRPSDAFPRSDQPGHRASAYPIPLVAFGERARQDR
ncbi:MAG TPA: hypothetical protein VNL77_06895, partial [Roseiflexaceae bacterium]|nr:hypothetical protein [Roseiflexaceae bacterium]